MKGQILFPSAILLEIVPLIQMVGMPGIVGIGRTHWRREHWTE
jgi:hypothetical protein